MELYKQPPLPPGCSSEYKKRVEDARAFQRKRRNRETGLDKESDDVRERPSVIPLHNTVDVRFVDTFGNLLIFFNAVLT